MAVKRKGALCTPCARRGAAHLVRGLQSSKRGPTKLQAGILMPRINAANVRIVVAWGQDWLTEGNPASHLAGAGLGSVRKVLP